MRGSDDLAGGWGMSGCNTLSLIAAVIMLDQLRVILFNGIDDLADDDGDVASIFAAVDLSRSAPTPIEQSGGRRHARLLRRTVPGDASQRLDAQFRMRPRQRSQICWCFSHLDWGCPSSCLDYSPISFANRIRPAHSGLAQV